MATLSSRLAPLTVSVPAASDWVSFTPTFNNVTLGSGSASAGRWRRTGDSVEVQFQLTLGTGGSFTGVAGVQLPVGLTADTAKLAESNSMVMGTARAYDASATTSFNILCRYTNVRTQIEWLAHNDVAGDVDANSPFTWAVNDQISGCCVVPISGWTSHVATTTGPNALVVGGQSVGSTLSFGATSNQGFNILANNAAVISSTAAGAPTVGLTSAIGGSTYAGVGIVGRTNGVAISAGYVGEIVEGKQTSVTTFPTTATYGDGASVSLTSGVWLLSAYIDVELNGSTTQSILMGISTTSGNSGTGLTFGDTLVACLPPTGTSNTNACMPQVIFRPTTTTTHYLKVRGEYSAGTPRYRCRLTAVRIA